MSLNMRPMITTWGSPMSMEFGTAGTREVLDALCDLWEVSYVDADTADDGDIFRYVICDGEKFLAMLKGCASLGLAAALERDWLLEDARKDFEYDGTQSDETFVQALAAFIEALRGIAPFWGDYLDDGELILALD